jgi:hypothetical protein
LRDQLSSPSSFLSKTTLTGSHSSNNRFI